MRRGHGMWAKLMAGFLLFAFLPMLALGYMQYSAGKRRIIEATRQNLSSIVVAINERISDYLAHAKYEIVTMSQVPDLARAAEDLSREGLSRDGLSSGLSGAKAARQRAYEVFRAFMSSEGSTESVFLLHPDTGEVLASSSRYDEGKFFDKRPYFLPGRQRLTVYPIHYSPSREKSILALSAPVWRGEKLVGVLVLWANIERMRNDIKLPQDAHVHLVNRSNMYVLDSNAAGGGLSILSGVFTPQAERALAGESGSSIHTDADGVRVVGAYAHVETLDLALMAEKPLSEALADVNSMGLKLLIIMLVIAIIAVAASIYASDRIAEPLSLMSERAMGIASGDQGETVEYDSNDEVGRLGRSMNIMAQRIRERDSRNNELISTLEALVQHMPEGVVLLDAQSRVVRTNMLGAAYIGELAGAGEGSVLGSIKGRQLDEFIVSPPQINWHEVEHQREAGAEPSHYSIAVRRIEGGRAGMVMAIKDITGERQMRDKAQSQEKLAAVGQLASGIAHDFSNIITCVMGFSEMLASDEKLSPDAMRQVEAIRQSAVRAGELIGQIMDFSRRSASSMRVLEMKAQVASFIRFINRILPENIQISIEAGQGKYLVNADASKLEQVLTNLAVNARDAMPAGGRLDFSLYAESYAAGTAPPPLAQMPEGRWIALEVSDTGHGMSEEVARHIFEPFYTTKGQSKGTGLGLAQVYGIVRQHNGFITVRSVEGKGTTFIIYLPESVEREPMELVEHAKCLPSGAGQTILVVEDDFVVKDIISSVFCGLGYKVVSAGGAEEALHIYERMHADISITITDIMMQGMDGITMCRRMIEIDPLFKAVVVSGYAPGSVRFAEGVDLPSVGIARWVQKPFQPGELARIVQEELSSAS